MKNIIIWLKKVTVMFSLLTMAYVCTPGQAFALTWETLPSMFYAKGYLDVVAADGLLYGIGGNDGSLINVVQAYNPLINSWSWKTSMLQDQCPGAAGVINHKIYVAGGYVHYPGDGYGNVNTLQIYDIASNTWSTGANLPVANDNRVGGVINDKFYVLTTGTTGFYAYDPSSNSWTTMASAPAAHRGGPGSSTASFMSLAVMTAMGLPVVWMSMIR